MFIFTLQDIIGMAFVGLFVLWWLLNLIGGRITAAKRKKPTNPAKKDEG